MVRHTCLIVTERLGLDDGRSRELVKEGDDWEMHCLASEQ